MMSLAREKVRQSIDRGEQEATLILKNNDTHANRTVPQKVVRETTIIQTTLSISRSIAIDSNLIILCF